MNSPLVGTYADQFPPTDRPWTQEYVDRHRALVSRSLVDPDLLERFRAGSELPQGYGIGFDERVVEIAWLAAQKLDGRVLDGGSALNHAHLLDVFLPIVDELHIVTLEPEDVAFPERRVSYTFGDLRDLPYRDAYFDHVVSLSTLEHIGMDNRFYGVDLPPADNPDQELERAVSELRRVLAPGGTLIVTAPYGAPEDHGWFRQFACDDVETLMHAVNAVPERLDVYAYSGSGWQVSDLDQARSATYRDFLADQSPVADLAAAARAVVCARWVI